MTPSEFGAWSVSEPNGDVTVFLRGELDLSTAARAKDALLGAVSRGGGRLTIDVSQLSFIDATGVRGLMSARLAAEAAGQPMHVTGAHGVVAIVLELLNFPVPDRPLVPDQGSGPNLEA